MPPFITLSASGYPEEAMRLAMFLNPGWRVMFPAKTTRVWMFRLSRKICSSRRVNGAESRTVSGKSVSTSPFTVLALTSVDSAPPTLPMPP